MIRGTVNDRFEPIIALTLRGPSGTELELDALVDTGFTAHMTLATPTAEFLGLTDPYFTEMVLADGTLYEIHEYVVEVEWLGQWKQTFAAIIGSEALIGMKLLAEAQLQVDVRTGGIVQISALPK